MNTLTLHAIVRLQLCTLLLSLVGYVKDNSTIPSHPIPSYPSYLITPSSPSHILLRFVILFSARRHQQPIAVWLPLVACACQVFPLNPPTLSAWDYTTMLTVISVCTSSPFPLLSFTLHHPPAFPLSLPYLMDFQLSKMVV